MRKGGAARAVLSVMCAALIVSGCQQRGGGLSTSGSDTPSGSASASSSARPTAPRPIAAEFAVERTRDPAEAVTGTIPLAGVVTGVEVDPIVGRAYVTLEGSLVALDVAGREIVDRIGLPGNYPRVAADPWAGVLYATRGGRIGELISVIDATTLETIRTLEVDGATLWGIAVDPTTGLLWVMEEGATEEDSARVAVVDPVGRSGPGPDPGGGRGGRVARGGPSPRPGPRGGERRLRPDAGARRRAPRATADYRGAARHATSRARTRCST